MRQKKKKKRKGMAQKREFLNIVVPSGIQLIVLDIKNNTGCINTKLGYN